MPKPSEIILELHRELGVTIEQLDEIDRADLAQVQLTATLKECEAVSTRLQNVKTEIVQAEAALKSKRHIVIDEAARRLRDVNEQITARKAELSSIQQGELRNGT